MRPHSLLRRNRNIRYVVTEDSDIKKNRMWDHWRWILVVLVIAGASAVGYVGLGIFSEEAADAVEEEVVELTVFEVSTASLSCSDYEVVVDDCTVVSIDDIKANGCEYYYELQTVDDVDYASACYCVVGTDSCARNEVCAETLELTSLVITTTSLSCTDYVEEVSDCTNVSIEDIKANGCENYYELHAIDDAEYASACYCVVGTDSCARNDDCAQEVDMTSLKITTASLSCTDYKVEVDDCTKVSIENIKSNGCEYYHESETIDGLKYASACYCVVGTDSCARNDDCAEALELQSLEITTASLSCTNYEVEVDDCTEVSIENIKSNGCEYYHELETIDGAVYASACYCVVGTDSCARNEECAEAYELASLKVTTASLSCSDYQVVVDDCTVVSIDDIKANGCEYYYELQTVDDVDFASACYCVVGTDSCARNEVCAETLEQTSLKINTASLSCKDYEEEVDACTSVSIESIKANGCEYYYEKQTINELAYASACYCVVGTDSCAKNEVCAETLDLTSLKITTASLSCTEYEEEVTDCTEVSIANIKSNGCGYYYEHQTVDGVDYASACYCVVGTDSCARNEACAETLDLATLKVTTSSLSCTDYEEEVSQCTEVSIENIKANGCGYYYELETIDDVGFASACYCVVGTDSCARNEACSETIEQTSLKVTASGLSCVNYEEEVDDCTEVSIDDIKTNGCGWYYEVQTIDNIKYASACYCVVGTDSCARNGVCAEALEKTTHKVTTASLSCTDYIEKVNDCTEVSIDNIKANGCEYYYEVQTIDDVDLASSCFCVVGTDSCSRNEACAEVL